MAKIQPAGAYPLTRQKLRVFLCHASEDKKSVRKLRNKLAKSGFDVWLDEDALIAGKRWALEIEQTLKTVGAVIICLTRSFARKEGYVQKELRAALEVAQEKLSDSNYLIPIKLEQCAVPYELRELHQIEYFKAGGYSRLLRALSERAKVLSQHSEFGGTGDFHAFFLQTFRQALSQRKEWLTVRPVITSSDEIDVGDLYVELFFRPSRHGRQFDIEQETAPSAAAQHYVTAESLLTRTSGRTVIVGPPGSGKTTLMKWICAYLLRSETSSHLTPVPVVLRDFAEALQSGQTGSLTEYAIDSVMGKGLPASEVASQVEVLDQAAVLYLLDGWDEVPTRMRRTVLNEIEACAGHLPLFVTSRVSAAAGLMQQAAASTFGIGSLTDGTVAELCARYGAARRRENMVAQVLQLIENNPSLWPLAGNPYLLTLLCEVVFSSPELPNAEDLSPVWLLSQAIELIRSDYNGRNQIAPLTNHDLQKMERLAYTLSFVGESKRVTFEPEADLGLEREHFMDSAFGRSRFFNANGLLSTTFSFAHLRIQEFLGARWILQSKMVNLKWAKRHVLSYTHREEAKFALALLLSSEDPLQASLRAWLIDLVRNPDHTGECIRLIASVVSAAGTHDGGLSVLGIDLREILWKRIQARSRFLHEDAQALIELDPDYLIRSLSDLDKRDDMLFEHLYRFLPLGRRRAELDPRLAASPVLSWVIGLPGRGFPTRSDLNQLSETALDDSRSMQERIRALRDLGSARARSQASKIAVLLDSSDEDLVTATVETLAKLGGKDAALAVARALIGVTAKHARTMPGFVAALLNALAAEGYGALEPYSRDLLVDAINNAPESCDNLELILDALAGTPLPSPPQRILAVLGDRTDGKHSLRRSAAAAVSGVDDTSFLLRVLELLKTEQDGSVRHQILTALPFIPIEYPDEQYLWQLCQARSKTDAAHAFLLISRTVEKFPNHPMAKPFAAFVEQTLSDFTDGQRKRLDEPVTQVLRTLRPRENLKPLLFRILNSVGVRQDIRADVAVALRRYQLTNLELGSIEKHFKAAMKLGEPAVAISTALAELIFTQKPESGARLAKQLALAEPRLGDTPLATLLKAAQRSGYLIFDGYTVSPDGRVLREKAGTRSPRSGSAHP